MTFDPDAYWRSTPPSEYPTHRRQEHRLERLLGSLDFDTALELGAGNGRITRLLAGHPTTVVDIAPDRVEALRSRLGVEGTASRIQDFAPSRTWDLVIAVEVLMHIPPSDIEAVCNQLRSLANRYIVTCDWSTPLPKGRTPAAHNWLHDYASLLRPTRTIRIGRQSIYLAVP